MDEVVSLKICLLFRSAGLILSSSCLETIVQSGIRVLQLNRNLGSVQDQWTRFLLEINASYRKTGMHLASCMNVVSAFLIAFAYHSSCETIIGLSLNRTAVVGLSRLVAVNLHAEPRGNADSLFKEVQISQHIYPIVRRLAASSPCDLRKLHKVRGAKKVLLNLGISHSSPSIGFTLMARCSVLDHCCQTQTRLLTVKSSSVCSLTTAFKILLLLIGSFFLIGYRCFTQWLSVLM